MKRGKPLSRSKPLRPNPSKPLRTHKPLAQRAGAGFGSKKSPIPAAVKSALAERSGGLCEARASSTCGRYAQHPHHRKLQSQGGEHTLENLLAVCLQCHAWIHAHPAISYERGWLVRANELPVVDPGD